jgi:hypothetical protein
MPCQKRSMSRVNALIRVPDGCARSSRTEKCVPIRYIPTSQCVIKTTDRFNTTAHQLTPHADHSPVLHVLPVVADFLARFPEIRVRLLLSDKNLDLVRDHVDMAVRIGRLPDSSMVATQIGTMRTVTCAVLDN